MQLEFIAMKVICCWLFPTLPSRRQCVQDDVSVVQFLFVAVGDDGQLDGLLVHVGVEWLFQETTTGQDRRGEEEV